MAEIIRKQLVLEVDGIDRLYLKDVPILQTEGVWCTFVQDRLGT